MRITEKSYEDQVIIIIYEAPIKFIIIIYKAPSDIAPGMHRQF